MASESNYSVSAGMKFTLFVIIECILAYFGDTFTFVLGTLIMILIFANGYNSEQAAHGHHEEAHH